MNKKHIINVTLYICLIISYFAIYSKLFKLFAGSGIV